jgi:hypothetical protein
MAVYGLPELGADILRITIGVLISTPLLRHFGKGWIDARFQQQLQKLKHEQEKELENVRLQVQLMYGRVSKIHQREFDVLPKAWLLLHEAHGYSSRMTAMLKQYPDVNLLSDDKLREILTNLKLTPVQISEIMASSERQVDFIKAYDGQQLDRTRESLRILNNFILEHQIFLDKTLAAKFREVTKDLMDSVDEFEHMQNGFDIENAKHRLRLMEGTGPKIAEILELIQNRLHYGEA